MSSTLVWEPVIKERNHALSNELKFLLRKTTGRDPVSEFFCNDDINYLNGLKDAGVKGAQELITAIEKHGEIKVYEDF
jgi:hypothetical protein